MTNPHDTMLCRRAKFGEDRTIFKMTAVRHLGFGMAS